MATAKTKVPAAPSVARKAAPASVRTPLAFTISQDNGGNYLWEIVDGGGKALVGSGGFASREDAESAAHQVHESARLARFGPSDPKRRMTVAA